MTHNLIIKTLCVFIVCFPSIALANYQKQCDVSFQSWVSPSMAGCVISAKKSGDLSFKLFGRNVTPKKCLSASGMDDEQINQFTEMEESENFLGENGVLLIWEQGNLISGKLTTNSFPNEAIDFTQLKKDLGGTAKATLDTGISIKLKVKKSAELTLSGDFGKMRLSGPCKKYSASTTTD